MASPKKLGDTEAKAALRTWPLATLTWSETRSWGVWVRVQPKEPNDRSTAPRLRPPGPAATKTQPDGLWIRVGRSLLDGPIDFADCVVVEHCGAPQNLWDKRARYSARTSSLMVELEIAWLDGEVPRRGRGGPLTTRKRLLGWAENAEVPAVLPVRHLQVVYAVRNVHGTALFDERFGKGFVLDAHEFAMPETKLEQWNHPEVQTFLKRMSPDRRVLWTAAARAFVEKGSA